MNAHAALFVLTTFWHDEEGPTAVEYAVMLALIVVVCMTSVSLMGFRVMWVYERVLAGLILGH